MLVTLMASTLNPAVAPTRTVWGCGCRVIAGRLLNDQDSAFASIRPPSVVESHRPACATLEGGKMFNATTRPEPFVRTDTSG